MQGKKVGPQRTMQIRRDLGLRVGELWQCGELATDRSCNLPAVQGRFTAFVHKSSLYLGLQNPRQVLAHLSPWILYCQSLPDLVRISYVVLH